MPRYLWIFGLGLVSIGLWGCGGGETVKPVEQAGANNNQAAGPAGGAAGGGAAGMPGAGGQRGAPQLGGGDSKAGSSSGSGSAQDLLLYVPEDLKIAAGADVNAPQRGKRFL